MKENIEEDIKIVQEFLIEQNKRKQRLIDNPYRQLFYTDEELQAIDHVISDYKRVLKENAELKEYKKIAELTKISCCIAQNCEALNNAIKEGLKNQRLQKENEEIKEKWDKDTHKLQNDLDIANAEIIRLKKGR